MNILIAPDSFKDSLSALEVAEAIQVGLHKCLPNAKYQLLPMADGGEGSCAALVAATQGELVRCEVSGPLGLTCQSFYGLLGQTEGEAKVAVIEMAAAAGLELLSAEQRNPWITTTYGVGELVLKALDQGVRQFVICLGGSATNDAGVGFLQALGACFYDRNHQPLALGGGVLSRLEYIDLSGLDPRLSECQFDVACDVDNPLLGQRGATMVYSAQKGADHEMQQQLEAGLEHFSKKVFSQTGINIADAEGAGAAGGLGAAFLGFLNTRMHRGVELILRYSKFDEHCKNVDWVITGEGRIDAQSCFGKTPVGVARAAKKHGAKVIALAGGLGSGYESVYTEGIDAVFSITQGVCSLEDALEQAQANMIGTARNIAAVIQISNSRNNMDN
ncbi:glycerate kinase [Oceanospirillum multiglobuliferum]|uniref:Glycerate kinase n=1 Tax=Oceanospirillum multiglobuliferum TaxID=64969 RepID=A0A1T4P0P6_9GAMM|nr:glycerate kinase [Oceanospirillum multiglobuliferum]OPX55091.1 glycerate kinase [Oceanospirillum multiglobuliferum]SJZ85075.1 glycerate kinase [Oceanospirillum multiglobuliferum]